MAGKEIRDPKTGRLLGSIGSGRTNVPTTRHDIPVSLRASIMPPDLDTVAVLWEAFKSTKLGEPVDDVPTVVIRESLRDLKDKGADIAETLEDIYERIELYEGSVTDVGRGIAERYKNIYNEINDASNRAQEEFRRTNYELNNDAVFDD